MKKCKHCGHSDDAHVAGECVALMPELPPIYTTVEGQVIGRTSTCGCIHLEVRARREPSRQWVIEVSFLLAKGGWTRPYQARPFAFGLIGAIAKGVREAKKAEVKPRSHIKNTKVLLATAIPSPKKAKAA